MATKKAEKKLEQAETVEETNISEAAIEEAKQEATLIAEKRSAKPIAKAGKRSAKAIKAAEDKQAKDARKIEAQDTTETDQPKQPSKPPRPKHERKSKGYQRSYELIDQNKSYSVSEALELATKTSHVNFDATVELHLNLNVDPRQADQNIRDTVVLPGGTGKTLRVAVFADDENLAKAKTAGADIAAGDEFLQRLDKQELDFDILISTPAMMAKLGKYARVLGPKGLMPNPKSGTVTNDIAKAVSEAKAGKVEYRVDSGGIIHVGIGKVSFGKTKLLDNARAIVRSIKANKPASVKGAFIASAHVTTSMGPSIPVDVADINIL